MKKITIDYIKEKLKSMNEDIEVISNEINNIKDMLEFKCLKHNILFKNTWGNISRCCKCPSCIEEEKIKYSVSYYKEKLSKLNKNIVITNKDGKIKSKDKLNFKCMLCGKEWSSTWYGCDENFKCYGCHNMKHLKHQENLNAFSLRSLISMLQDNFFDLFILS